MDTPQIIILVLSWAFSAICIRIKRSSLFRLIPPSYLSLRFFAHIRVSLIARVPLSLYDNYYYYDCMQRILLWLFIELLTIFFLSKYFCAFSLSLSAQLRFDIFDFTHFFSSHSWNMYSPFAVYHAVETGIHRTVQSPKCMMAMALHNDNRLLSVLMLMHKYIWIRNCVIIVCICNIYEHAKTYIPVLDEPWRRKGYYIRPCYWGDSVKASQYIQKPPDWIFQSESISHYLTMKMQIRRWYIFMGVYRKMILLWWTEAEVRSSLYHHHFYYFLVCIFADIEKETRSWAHRVLSMFHLIFFRT